MNKQVLDNIFAERGDVTFFASVERRLSSTSYEVVDHAGRKSSAMVTGGAFYPKGVRVMVQNGRIIGSGRRGGKHRVYRVRGDEI